MSYVEFMDEIGGGLCILIILIAIIYRFIKMMSNSDEILEDI